MGRSKHWGPRLGLVIAGLLVLLTACSRDSSSDAPVSIEQYTVPPNLTPVEAPTDQSVTMWVEIQNSAFHPTEMTIAAGTRITWINQDDIVHSIVSGKPGSPDGRFDSGPVDSSGTFSYTFEEPGIYEYYCGKHPGEQGVVNVE